MRHSIWITGGEICAVNDILGIKNNAHLIVLCYFIGSRHGSSYLNGPQVAILFGLVN